MAKPNYSFEKRQREIAKKKKLEEKDAKKRAHSAKRPRTPTRQNRLELTAEAPGRRVHTTLLDYLRPLFTVDYPDCHSWPCTTSPSRGVHHQRLS